jgi:predicted permease
MNRRERELEKELQFHLERHIADLVEQGHSPEEARRLARMALGGPEQVKEQCRDARPARWLEDFFQDVRYALRALRQRPGFSSVALLTLALGIGATTLMFTVVNGVLLKSFPYAHPGRLVKLEEQTTWSTQWGNRWSFSYPNYLDCRRELRSAEMVGFHYSGGIVSAPGPAEYIDSFEISPEVFSVLGIELFRGRAFLDVENRPGAAQVVIISYRLWQRRFAARADAVGSELVFDGRPRIVVGVTPSSFRIGDNEIDIFTPLGQDDTALQSNREAHGTAAWARLRPGATLAQLNSELAVIGRRLEAQYPASNQGRSFVADVLRPDAGDAQATLWLLFGAVSLVLLIACANIASLFLARAISRQREMAMRAALGAGRGRLIRQCLTESVVLGLGGGALGVALAAAGLHPFLIFWPRGLPRAGEVHLDARVLLFAGSLSLLSGLVFGLAPALHSRTGDFEIALRAGGRTVAGNSRRLHGAFVVAQIALAMTLLVSAGMLGQTVLRLSSLGPGLNVRNLLVARVALSSATLADPQQARAAWREILDRVRSVPSVKAAAIIDTVPMREGSNAIPYSTTPAIPPAGEAPRVLANCTVPDYLKVAGLPLRAGRFLTDQDRFGTEPVVVIDEVMAREAFPGQNPIGKHVWLRLSMSGGGAPSTVVGVVGHVRQWGLAGDDGARLRAQLYYPWAQVPDPLVRRWSEVMSIAVRTEVDPLTLVEPLRREVRGATNDQVLYEVRTMEQLAATSLARQRFLLLLFGVFAGLALLLACIGIYGVLAYLTSRRVPEIGVRMALGATSGEVMWMVLRQSLGMIFLGLGAGACGAVAAARLLVRFVTGMQPAEPWTLAGMIGILLLAALTASFFPARRAARIDPVLALRRE